MKKLLVFALLSLNILALDFYVGLNANVDATEWNPKATNIQKKEYKDEVYGLTVELTQAIPFVELGLGLGYEPEYKYANYSFDVMPVYGLAKFNLFPLGVKPYVVAKYGKTVYEEVKGADMKDGAYYSVGLGITLLKKLQVEGAYSLSTGKKDGADLNLTKGSIALRYNVF